MTLNVKTNQDKDDIARLDYQINYVVSLSSARFKIKTYNKSSLFDKEVCDTVYPIYINTHYLPI